MAAPWHRREIEVIPLFRTNKRPLRKIRKLSSFMDGFSSPPSLRFGPYYHADDSWVTAKEDAWRFVLEKSPENQETSDIYLSAIGRIDEKARATYQDEALQGLTESQFQWMMIKDGCFFLQLALFILGASMQLGYPIDHWIFGAKEDKKDVLRMIESMFYVGNQIPLVVLNVLMKQTFFQNVIRERGKWERPTDLLSKQVLYDLLILPATGCATRNTASSLLEMLGRKTYMSEEQPSDLLHGLQNMLLGPRVPRNDSCEEDEEDADEEEGDLEAGRPLNIKESLCVSKFAKKGIHLWESTGIGIRGIQFKINMFHGRLYLPTMLLNEETEMLFGNLKSYEWLQGQNEVALYLGFMNQLISTFEDVELLAKKGIIRASKPYYKKRFLRLLRSSRQETTDLLRSSRQATTARSAPQYPRCPLCPRYRYILQQVEAYNVWDKFQEVAMLAFILTILQTIFAALSYVSQLRQSPA